MEHLNQTSEVKRALQEKVLLDDGRVGFVFSELVQIGPSNRWHCHVCSRTVDSERALVMHLSHPLHTVKLRAIRHPAKNFSKFAGEDDSSKRKDPTPPKPEGTQSSWDMTTDVLPGEPVPPGMEDVVEGVCQIQATFDEHSGPLIGLEYIVELVTSEEESEPRYICLLCEKKGDPRSLMVHVTSQNHCLKYISCFFRTAGNALNMIPRTLENRKGLGAAITKIAQEIEKHYGRLKPTSAVAETFSLKKYEILRQIDEKEHFRETPNTTFASYATPEKIQEYSLQDDFEHLQASAQKNKNNKTLSGSSPTLYDPSAKGDKPGFNATSFDKGLSKDIKKEKPIIIGKDDTDPIEVTSSISSVSSSVGSDDGKKDDHLRRSSSRERYSRKRRLSPELEDRRRYLYRASNRRALSPYSSRHSRLRSRSRSRDRDLHRRLPDYYRDRDRTRRSPSYGRSRPGRTRYEDRYSEERYRRKSPDRYDRDRNRDRRRRADSRDRGESRDKRDRSLDRQDRSREGKKESETKWDKYRAELHQLELTFENKLKYFEERPEKHPKYSEEWKGFWNKRYKEIQLSGKDPTTYDFKPEWIIYWAKRMKELSEEDFNKEREALKKKMNVEDKPEKPPSSDLQDISPPTPESQKDVTVDDIKNTWKALTGTEITAPNNQTEKTTKRSPSPWESSSSSTVTPTVSHVADSERSSISTRKPYDIAPPVLHCLRMLSVLEHQLGSLGPKVMELLSRALVLERSKYNSSMTLLKDVDIHIFFETVKEKIRGQLIAGIVMRNLVSSSRAIIKAIETMLDTNPPLTNKLSPTPTLRVPPTTFPTSEPVQVPGIGMIDKMAVAQQIASALVAQGKTDVTQEKLEDLINAVVGIAKASNANVSKNLSSAAFFSQLNIENSTATSHINEILSNMISSAQKSLGMESKKPIETSVEIPQPVQPVVQDKKPTVNTVLNTLQSVGQSSDIKSNITSSAPKENAGTPKKVQSISPVLSSGTSKDVSDEELKEKLMKFSMLPRDEQQNLITLLKELETTQSERVVHLRKYVSIGLVPMASEKNNQGKEVSKDGRLSPFSSRVGGANPAPDDTQKGKQKGQLSPDKNDVDDDDDDDDYSVEDVYKAASEKLFKKNESTKNNQGSALIKRDNTDYDNNSSSGKGFGIQSITTLPSTISDIGTVDKGGPILPILSGQTNSNLISNQDRNIRSSAQSVMDNLFGRNDSYQISLDSQLGGSQNEVSNNFMGVSYKNYEGVKQEQPYQRNIDQYEHSYFTESGNNKNQEFGGNDYNNFTSREAVNYGYNDQTHPSYDSVQSRPYSNQNWQFGSSTQQYINRGPDDNSVKPPMNYQQIGRNNAPPQGYFRGQNNEQPFGGYRQNF